jgi:hypothetical protein
MKSLRSFPSSRRRFLFACLAAIVLPVTPADCADAPGAGSLDLRIPKQDGDPVFHVDQNTLTPAMEIYLNAVREKIRQSGARDWPEDVSGRKMPGEVVVQITLQKNGYIKELQTSTVAGGSSADDDNALSASVAQQVRRAQPFAPFAPRNFAGYELIAFGMTVGSAPGAAHQTDKPRVDAQGIRERMELRTRIPF